MTNTNLSKYFTYFHGGFTGGGILSLSAVVSRFTRAQNFPPQITNIILYSLYIYHFAVISLCRL